MKCRQAANIGFIWRISQLFKSGCLPSILSKGVGQSIDFTRVVSWSVLWYFTPRYFVISKVRAASSPHPQLTNQPLTIPSPYKIPSQST